MFLLFLMILYTLCAVGFLLSVVENRPIHKRGRLQAISLLLFIEFPSPVTQLKCLILIGISDTARYML